MPTTNVRFPQEREGDHCLYKATFYAMKTRHPRTWIHLMFLALQARSSSAIRFGIAFKPTKKLISDEISHSCPARESRPFRR